MAKHDDRKLLAKGFLSDVKRWRIIPTGNNSTGDFSTQSFNRAHVPFPSYRHAAPLEMTGRRGVDGIHSSRKLFAYGFLFDVKRWRIIATGNYLRKVSCPK